MATGKSKRGFASMDPEKQREIASKGGQSVPAEKRSFSQDRELASEAGRKGGQASGTTRANEVYRAAGRKTPVCSGPAARRPFSLHDVGRPTCVTGSCDPGMDHVDRP